jgi:hypothetical protein
MTRRPVSILAAVGLLWVVAGCDNFLDVNTNPNQPERVAEELSLPAVLGLFSFGVLGSWPATLGAEWTQQISYNGSRTFSQIQRYEINESEADRLWWVSYIQIMNDARRLAQDAEASGRYAYAGIAKLIFAWNLAIVTDMYGPVPFNEAFDPTNTTPAYDPQDVVYAGVRAMIAEAIEDLERDGPRPPAQDDLLFAGDLDAWLRLAHTLLARTHLQTSLAPGEDRQQRAQAALDALADGFTSSADDADFQYFAEEGRRNPWYRVRLGQDHYQLGEFYVELLQGLGDPRLSRQALPADSLLPDTVYVGHRNAADPVSIAFVSRISDHYVAEAAAHTWISYADALLMEAEARLVVDGPAAADSPYRAGIRASMEKLGVTEPEIDAYLGATPSLADAADPLREIITQKYIANFLDYQAFNDYRRTGYPELTPVEGAVIDGIPRRFRFAGSELSNNIDNVQATGMPLGIAGMAVPVWWDTR